MFRLMHEMRARIMIAPVDPLAADADLASASWAGIHRLRGIAVAVIVIVACFVCSSSSFPSDRSHLGLATGRKGDAVRSQPAPPIVNLGRNVSSPYRTQRHPNRPCDHRTGPDE